MFAREFTKHFPHAPVEEEGRLHDMKLRENFLERVFVYKRWKDYVANDGTVEGLKKFHNRHKYLLMSHSQDKLAELSQLITSADTFSVKELHELYLKKLMYAMSIHSSPTKNSNVMFQLMNHFENKLSHDEKMEMLEQVEIYQKGYAPLIVPIVLLQHYVRKYNVAELSDQYFLFHYPDELCLRNRV